MIRWLARSAAPCVAVLLISASASAQPAKPADPADVAFFRGRALMQQGDRAGACAAFRDSEALRPAAGTELNLATCLDGDGALVAAAAMLEQARARAEARGEANRVALAVSALDALRARIPTLAVTVPSGRRVALTIDGVAIASADLAAPIALDPGAHAVSIAWDGGAARVESITLREGERVTRTAPPVAEVPVDAPPPIVARPRAAARSRLPLYLGGAAVALAGGGAYAFLAARSLDADARALCPMPQACADADTRSRADDANRRAVRDARIAVGLWVGAGALATAATYLWWRGRDDAPAPVVSVGAGGATLAYARSF